MTRPVDHRDVILQSLKDYGRQLERALLNLGQIEARWMPTLESNHILWILWHMGRMEDMWAWYLRGGGESAWIEGGWSESIGIDASRNGAGDTIEQVRDFPEISVEKISFSSSFILISSDKFCSFSFNASPVSICNKSCDPP